MMRGLGHGSNSEMRILCRKYYKGGCWSMCRCDVRNCPCHKHLDILCMVMKDGRSSDTVDRLVNDFASAIMRIF